jgi:hypothetical protein
MSRRSARVEEGATSGFCQKKARSTPVSTMAVRTQAADRVTT